MRKISTKLYSGGILKKYLKLADEISSYISNYDLEKWINKDIAGQRVFIRVGEFCIVSIEKIKRRKNEAWTFSVHAFVSKKATYKWFYKDWFLFCSNMREIGIPVEEGSLNFDSAVNEKEIYKGFRVL